jgi:hypothetical protein
MARGVARGEGGMSYFWGVSWISFVRLQTDGPGITSGLPSSAQERAVMRETRWRSSSSGAPSSCEDPFAAFCIRTVGCTFA